MLIGQSLLAPPDGGAVYYTPWLSRQGDSFVATVGVLRASGVATLTCEVETKNAEDPDSAVGSPLATITMSLTGSSVGVVGTAQASGCLELVRYKITIEGAHATTPWVHVRSDPPMWLPN